MIKKLRICICHTDLRIYWEDRLLTFAAYCRDKGAELSVIEIAGKGSPYSFATSGPDAGKWWHCLHPESQMENLDLAECASEVGVKLTELDVDVVIAGALAYPSGAGAVRWGVATGKKVVIMDNARPVDVPRSRLVNWVKRRVYREVDAVFLPAPSYVEDYGFWSIPVESMHFGLNAVNNNFFMEGARIVREAEAIHRNRLHLPKRFLLGVGRQVKKKNWMILLRAWSVFRLEHAQSDLKLVLLGNGPERANLVTYARSVGCNDVHFLDFVPQKEIVSYYATAEALVLPSQVGETWGLVVNEAMSCGLPVIVSRQCGCSSTLVRQGENGWLVDSENERSIVDAICAMAETHRDRLVQMGANSREIVDHWGLQRFCAGGWSVAQYALNRPSRSTNWIDACIINLWNGRYRPT